MDGVLVGAWSTVAVVSASKHATISAHIRHIAHFLLKKILA
jgi:hypothetical protein